MAELLVCCDRLGEMMLAEDDKNELACKDLHHVREQHIKDEKARFKVRLPLSTLCKGFSLPTGEFGVLIVSVLWLVWWVSGGVARVP